MKKINKTNFVKHANTFKLIKTLLKLLSKKNKLNLSFLIIIILLNGLTEVVSISATIPVISIILNQENFLNSKWGLFISNTFKNQNLSQLTLITTIVFIFLIFLSTLIRTINIYFTTKLNANIGYDFGKEMIENTLRRPYEEQINTKSSDLINRQTYFVEQTNRALIDFIQAFGNSIISLFILSYLFYLNAATCISALILFSSIYYIFSILSKRKLSQNSLRNIKLKEARIIFNPFRFIASLYSPGITIIVSLSHTLVKAILIVRSGLSISPVFKSSPWFETKIVWPQYTQLPSSNVARGL